MEGKPQSIGKERGDRKTHQLMERNIPTDSQIYGEIERGKQADKKKYRQTDKDRRLYVYE